MRGASLLALAALALAGCGYVGPPLAPALNIPVQIRDLRGVQRGDKIYVAFTPPMLTTEKLVLKSLPEIELRVGENPKDTFEPRRWASESKRILVKEAKPEGVELSFPATEWAGREVIVLVRTVGPTKRPSDWSSPVLLHVEPTPQPPVDLTVISAAQGTYLRWKGAGTLWRVWRMDEPASSGSTPTPPADPQPLGVATEASWLDQTAVLGKSYVYSVQQLVGAGERPAESEMSAPKRITHEDKFPPAVPGGLTVITGLKTVELSWDRNTEVDLKGYQVYRAEGDSALAKLGVLVDKPSYSDPNVQSGKKYRYAVAAVDEAGNESAACTAVEVNAP